MISGENKIHIALAFDQNFITPFYVLLTSIFSNNKKHEFVFHTIATGVDKFEKDKIEKYIHKNKGEIFFYEIDLEYVNKFVILEEDKSYFTPAIFYRFFFPFIVPEKVKRLLYLDVDIVVVGDLLELYNINIDSVPLAAVVDKGVDDIDFGVDVLKNVGIFEKGQYFNSGVLLMNLDKWKSEKISEKAIKFLTEHPEKIKFPDQDALNAVLINNWYKLDCRFNLMRMEVPQNLRQYEYKSFLKDKVIIHYTTTNKPWNFLCTNRLRHVYHYYLRKSPRSWEKKYKDFKWTKKSIKQFFVIRLVEFNFNYPRIFIFLKRIKRYL